MSRTKPLCGYCENPVAVEHADRHPINGQLVHKYCAMKREPGGLDKYTRRKS